MTASQAHGGPRSVQLPARFLCSEGRQTGYPMPASLALMRVNGRLRRMPGVAISSREPEPLIARMIGGNAARQFAIPPVGGPVLTA
jgi:hypothetical protein